MKKTSCDICLQTEIPLNHSIIIDGQIHCSSCFETQFPDRKELEGRNVEQIADGTVCADCQRDFGNIELEKVGTYHMCTDCQAALQKRIFPLWVKGFFAAIIVIVIVGFAWNWRYYSAYQDVQQSIPATEAGNYALAASLMQKAGGKVPERPELSAISHYYRGIDFMSKDKSALALPEFNKSVNGIPAYDLEPWILRAKIGIAFDTKNYRQFLALAETSLKYDSLQPYSITMVASAYACVFASEGNEEDKQLAYSYIEKAKKIDSTTADLLDYYNQVEYRIYSRSIITNEEFHKKFPNGWTKK